MKRVCERCGQAIELDVLDPLATAPDLLCTLCEKHVLALAPKENTPSFEVEALELDGVVLDVTVKI